MNKIQEKHVFYVFLLIVFGCFTSMALDVPKMYGVVGDPGPGFIPLWFSIIAELLLVYLIVTEVFLNKTEDKIAKLTKHEVFALILTIALVVSYLLALSNVGFLVSTCVFLFVYKMLADFLISGIKPTKSSALKSLVFSLISTAAIYFIFGVVFKLSLP
ncbi:tripartite tricarboxylate transporter TctB family protein [Vibrio sp. CDRSL-10 TSBA]